MSHDPIDPTLIEELIELDPESGVELVREVIGIFFAEAPARLDLMRSGLAEGDVNRVIQSAHAMKGGAHSLGAMQVAQLCADIEERGRRGDVADLGQVVDLIEVILPRIGSALEARVAAIARTLAGT